MVKKVKDLDDFVVVKDKVFRKKLIAAAAAIRAEADGKTCGDCRHVRDSWCADQKNIEGQPLSILYPTAPACREFTPKPIPRLKPPIP